MALHAFDDLEDAFALTRSYLFPFDLKQWLRLALIVFFIGGASGGGGGGGTNFNVGENDVPGGIPGDLGPLPELGQVVVLVLAAVAVLLLVALVFGLVGSVMEFVLLDSLRSEVHVRRFFRANFGKGLRLFGFRLVLFLAVLVPVGGLAAAFFLNAGPDVGAGEVVAGWLLLVPLLVVLAVVVGLVNALTTAFIAPVMLLEDRGVLAAWRRFWPTLRAEWKEYAVYVVLAFVLGAIVNTAVGIAVGILALLVAIPFVGIGAAGFALGGASTALWVLVGALVLLFVLLVIAVASVVKVPVVTYFRYYALLLLGDTNTDLDLIPDQREGIREVEEHEGRDGATDAPA